MINRCMNERDPDYPQWGGRGITIDPHWLGERGFENFLKDMGKRPSPEMSLDRSKNDGPYTKSNCRWATKKEQANNRRSNTLITAHGQTQTLGEWATATGIKRATITERIRNGWRPDRAVTTPTLRSRYDERNATKR